MPDQPNVVLILVDDMGFADLGVMGSEIHTPNIDNLANNGTLFTSMSLVMLLMCCQRYYRQQEVIT